jgi:hypothetical protein
LLGHEGVLAQVVNEVHYGEEKLKPGDITLAVTKTEGASLAVITEGSGNWPRRRDENGFYLLEDEMKTALAERVEDIRERLGDLATGISFFEANGICPQSLPGMGRNTDPIIVVRGFNGAFPLDSRSLSSKISGAVGKALSYKSILPPHKISIPDVIQELSGSSAGAEVEVILPCSQF